MRVNVLDQLMGLKVACQNPLFHITLLIILCFCSTGSAFDCTERNYRIAYAWMMFNHLFAFIPFFTTMVRFAKEIKCLHLEKALELMSLISYLLGIFYVQDVLSFDIGVEKCVEDSSVYFEGVTDLATRTQNCDEIYCFKS